MRRWKWHEVWGPLVGITIFSASAVSSWLRRDWILIPGFAVGACAFLFEFLYHRAEQRELKRALRAAQVLAVVGWIGWFFLVALKP
ncbi:MAG TPA: hypothetical protein GX529_06935 [Firmicutes bacterium]|nr:hypothetical protein [Candidatus Fermentithermobacillaceae bacterium]